MWMSDSGQSCAALCLGPCVEGDCHYELIINIAYLESVLQKLISRYSSLLPL